jgi:hypothetical protein
LSGDTNARTSLASAASLDWPVDAPGGVNDTFATDSSASFVRAHDSGNPGNMVPSVSGGQLVLTETNFFSSDHYGRYDNRSSNTGDVLAKMQLANVPSYNWGIFLGFQTGDSQSIGATFDPESGANTIRITLLTAPTGFYGTTLLAATAFGATPVIGDWLEFKRVGNQLTVTLYASDGVTVRAQKGVAIPSGNQARFGAGTQGYAGLHLGGPAGGGGSQLKVENWIVSSATAARSNVKRFSSNIIGSDADWRARDLIAGRYIKLPVYTLATLPTAASLSGAVVFVSDAATGQQFKYSDGTNWIVPGDLGTPNTQTGTTYTLVLADGGKSVEMNNAGGMTLTVPPNSSVAYPIGTRIRLTRMGAGTLTIAQGAGVTLPNKVEAAGTTNRTVSAQWGVAELVKRATDQWVLSGDIA